MIAPTTANRESAGRIASLARAIGVNSAVAYSVASRLWQLMSATFTVVLMTQLFSRELQGVYYTIVSLLAIQAFIDLGLSGIVVLLASHEWAHLKYDGNTVEGDDKAFRRLAEIYRFGCRWYFYCGMAFLCLVGPVGIWVLSDSGEIRSEPWLIPWLLVVTLNAGSMTLLPRISLLEGCDMVRPVNRMRLCQSIAGSIAVWVSIASGLGLWTLVVSNLVRILFEAALVHYEFRGLLSRLSLTSGLSQLSWKKEIWPLQWRLAIQSVFGYFATWFMVPVIYRFHGEVRAGQIGLTWQLLTTVQAASLAWVQARLPKFGALLASEGTDKLEKEMFRVSLLAIAVFTAGIVGFFVCIALAEFVGLPIIDRFISAPSILFFAAGLLGWILCSAEQSYVRLFKTDPFLLFSVVSSCLIGIATWYFGSTSGVRGISIAFFLIVWVYSVPISTAIMLRHHKSL